MIHAHRRLAVHMTPDHRAHPKSLAVLLTMLALTLPGCGGLAWFLAQTPPQDIPPKYTFPEDKTVLVLVDDPAQHVHYSPVKYELTRSLNEQLEKHDIAKKTIDYRRLMKLITATPGFNRLSTAEIGKKLTADLVLYVQIEHFQLKDDPISPIWHGQFKTSVRVVDVKKGRLWPKDLLGGYPIPQVERPRHEGEGNQHGQTLARELADEMADRIAKLFYKHAGRPHDKLPPRDDVVEP